MSVKKPIVVVLESDYHAGSDTGLNPFPQTPIQKRVVEARQDAIKWAGEKPDYLIVAGDIVDGEQKRGRSALDVPHLETQMDWGVNLLKMWKPKRQMVLVAGTQYHVGGDMIDAESVMAKRMKEGGRDCFFTRKLNMEINGWFRLEVRHYTGSSTIPHGRHTAAAKSRTWNVLNAAQRNGKWPHLIVRAHVHYWQYSEDAWGASMTLPGWQALGGRYGDEICDGHVDMGLVKLRVGAKKEDGWAWEKKLYQAAVVDRVHKV